MVFEHSPAPGGEPGGHDGQTQWNVMFCKEGEQPQAVSRRHPDIISPEQYRQRRGGPAVPEGTGQGLFNLRDPVIGKFPVKCTGLGSHYQSEPFYDGHRPAGAVQVEFGVVAVFPGLRNE